MRSTIRVLIVGFVSGCNTPQIEPPDTASESGDPSTTGTTGSTSDAPTTGAPTSTEGTSEGPTGSSGDPTATTGAVDCEGPNGCFDCPPTRPVEVLNACTDATCEPFANKERLPLLGEDGTLPPLP